MRRVLLGALIATAGTVGKLASAADSAAAGADKQAIEVVRPIKIVQPLEVVIGPAPVSRSRLALLHENDFFGNSDRDYTSGVLMTLHQYDLSRRLSDAGAPLWFRGATRFLNGWLSDTLHTRSQALALGQMLFTPTDYRASDVVRSERPYAGWLFGRLAVHGHSDVASQTIALELGMLGPIAQGERSQNFFHALEGYPRFQGWRNQLRNELGVQLYRENRVLLGRMESLSTTVVGHYGGALGNVLTYANVGARMSVGGNPITGSRAANSMSARAPLSSDRLQVFAAFDARAIARNAFLDGNTFRDSHSVERKPLVTDLSLGLSGNLLGADLSYVHTFRSKEFAGQTYTQRFGSLMISFAL